MKRHLEYEIYDEAFMDVVIHEILPLFTKENYVSWSRLSCVSKLLYRTIHELKSIRLNLPETSQFDASLFSSQFPLLEELEISDIFMREACFTNLKKLTLTFTPNQFHFRINLSSLVNLVDLRVYGNTVTTGLDNLKNLTKLKAYAFSHKENGIYFGDLCVDKSEYIEPIVKQLHYFSTDINGIHTKMGFTGYGSQRFGQFKAKSGMDVYETGVYYYKGDWKNGEVHGQGEFRSPLLRYIGSFENGSKHGEGKLYIDGIQMNSVWENNKMITI